MFSISRYTCVQLLLLPTIFLFAAVHAAGESPRKLSYDLAVVDAAKGPEAAAATDRLDALGEAVRRFELYNENTKVKLYRVDRDAAALGRKLQRADGAVFGTAAALDDAVAGGAVTITANVNIGGYSDALSSLLDTLTAFVDGSEGIVIDGAGGAEVSARRFVPPMFGDLEPRRARPGDLVLMTIDYGYYGSVGSMFADVGGTSVALAGPDIDLETFELHGYNLLVPRDAASGYVRLEIPSAGTPAVNRVLYSPVELQIEPLAEAAAAPAPAPAPAPTTHCNDVTVTFKRLGSPNFFSEIADSKDVVIADYENDGKLDVFVPQTLSDPETEYKGQGNDAAGLPKFATIVSGLLTNDVTGKRQYGASAGDIDGDGDLDIVPSGSTAQGASERTRLLFNNGNLTFTNRGTTRISNYNDVSTSAQSWDEISLADVDGDGDLDVAMANRSTASGGRSALLLNTGGGYFDAYPDAFGEPASEVHHDVHFCDVDNDGDPDVLMSQDLRGPSTPLRLMVNNGDGNPGADVPPTFSDGSSRLIPNPAAISEHVACADFDNDGWQDIHVGTWSRTDQSDNQDMIFINNTADTNFNGTIELSEIRFDLVSNPDPSSSIGEGFRLPVYSAAYGDFTNDGKVDVIVNSFVGSNKGPYLMCNNGDGTFRNLSPTGAFWRDLSNTGFDHFNATSADVADLNVDGKPDVVFGLGDTMNGPWEEANRIYVLDTIVTSGGTHCSQLYDDARAPEPEPCFEADFTSQGIELDPKAAGEVRLLPLASACRGAVDCGACGNPYLSCEERFELVFDFAAVGVDPKIAGIRLIDFAGRELAVGRDRGGQKILSFVPEGEFRKDGLDQELLVELRLQEPVGTSGVEVPVRLEREPRK